MSENIAAAIAAKNEVIAQQGTSLDEVAAVLETKAAGGGTDISLGLTSAEVGQTIKVKAVDESGKPTAWEAAEMPIVQNWAKVNMTGTVGQFIAVSAVDDGGNVTAIAPVTIPNAEEASF